MAFEFEPQFMMIENLAVEDDDDVAVRADERLVSALEIENAQTGSSERYRIGFEAALWSGPRCVSDSSAASMTPRGRRFPTCVYPRMPHMLVSAFFGQKNVRVYPLRRTHFYDLIDRPGKAHKGMQPA